jgi:Holliday junction resolvase RusA-like endonuclease
VIRFWVAGRAAPKGSRINRVRANGTVTSRPASKYERPWVDEVKRCGQIAGRHAPDPGPPYAVELLFLIPRPANSRYAHPAQVDVDKLARAVIDGLVNAKLMSDDRHVTTMTATKRFAVSGEVPGVRISLQRDPVYTGDESALID